MEWGLCIGSALLGRHRDAGTLPLFWAVLQEAGVDYLELPVGGVMGSAPEFEALRKMVATAPLPVPAFNGFLPPPGASRGRRWIGTAFWSIAGRHWRAAAL